MPLKPFDQLPDHARLWVFPGSRPLSDQEAAALLSAADEFLDTWTAHRVPLATGRELRFNQFLFVTVDEASAGASGCSIDALVRFMRNAEQTLGVSFTDNAPVWFRTAAGAIASVSRPEFQRLVNEGRVGPDTVVFDHTIESALALRQGRWEVPMSKAWHARAFVAATALRTA